VFEGGTSFVFTKAPLFEDEVEIYYYKGLKGTDAQQNDSVKPTIEPGDIVQVNSNNTIPNTITQEQRTVYDLTTSDTVETNRYAGIGIDDQNQKPVSWTKQKIGKKINGEFISKTRDSIEPLIFPTAKIIKDVSTTDTEVFIENSKLFSFETDNTGYTDDSTPCNALVINGISTTGFTTGLVENITGFSAISGASGIVTGIGVTGGGSDPLSITFSIIDTDLTLSGIETGYPIYINETNVGNGVTAIDTSGSDSNVIGIGTTCLDSIYYIADWSSTQLITNVHVGVITCYVHSDVNTVGIATTGSHPNDLVGRYSWGKLSGGTRSSNPISIGVTENIISGLSTYPTIQRRGVGIRKTGALPKRES
tara:strand:- start:864 stop:1958 length:1095 start_codon:yes stop_codon:yes gene_type:complete